MSSAPRHGIGSIVALFACVILPQAALAQAPPAGVFSELQTAWIARPGSALEPGTVRSRVVQVDTQKITAARRGREVLKLNLFDDAVVEVQIKRVRPTRSGYFISGRPKGMQWGAVRLVVNGPVMVGTVETPEGTFTIRSGGSNRHVIRQIDPSAEPFECEVEEGPAPVRPEPAIASMGPLGSLALPPTPQADDMPTEDGSEIRVLVVYTPTVQNLHGGAAGMRALIDLFVQSANQAFEDSGIHPRLVLAHSAMVNYVEETTATGVSHLRDPNDGYMDEVHALRNKYAADLVHLVGRGRPPGLIDVGNPSGSAYWMRSEDLSFEARAFAATWAPLGSPAEYVFTHETGHNLGLLHDRYVEKSSSALYPYAYGYINKRAFELGAPESARWRTLMAYNDRCLNEEFPGGCEWLLRFSNPDQTYRGDPLGVPADDPTTGPDGPADARLTINKTARWVGSFRSEACTNFTVSPERPAASVDGGKIILQVDTTPGCLWEALSQAEFLQVTSGALYASTDVVTVEVQANRSGAKRSGTLAVAGKHITVRQLASAEGVCGRTSGVFQAITMAAGFSDAAQCDEVTEDDLAGIISLDLRQKGLDALKKSDFEGLSGLQRLDLDHNELTELPEDVFAGLSNLSNLNVGNNRLTELPEGLFGGLSGLETLFMRGNQLNDLPQRLFHGLSSLSRLNVENNRLTELPEGLFAGLSGLVTLEMAINRMNKLPAGLFTGLSNLRNLHIGSCRLAELPAGLFAGLSNLGILSMESNRLKELPEGLFEGLSNLGVLYMYGNQLEYLPEGLFAGLLNLHALYLYDNRLTELPEGLFAGLLNLKRLNLYHNRLTELPVGLFDGLSSLDSLRLYDNRLTELPVGLFDGLSSLDSLRLSENRLAKLPDGFFSGLPALQELNLLDNAVDPLPLSVSLEKVGDRQFKAVAPSGVPSTVVLPVSSSSAGTIDGGASTVTIPFGAEESMPLGVTRVLGSEEAVTVDIGTLPGLPANHQGYAFRKDEILPLEIIPPHLRRDATLTDLSMSDGTLDPTFAADINSYTATVENAMSSVTVTLTTRNSDATAAFLDANDGALPDADETTEGHQVILTKGKNTIRVEVMSEDGTTTRIYTLVVTRDGATGVCGRTAQVRDVIVAAVSGVNECFDVTEAHLSGITRLVLRTENISTLKSGDFAGLSTLSELDLWENSLTNLPEDAFSGLAALERLNLGTNQLSALPSGIFFGLSALKELYLDKNQLTTLPPDVFSGLTALQKINLWANKLDSLPAGVFAGLAALQDLSLEYNRLSSLPAEVFAGLAALQNLNLGYNRLSNLPAGVFSGLTGLQGIGLHVNRLSSLPAGVFSGLTKLKNINLNFAGLSSLPGGIFSGLASLEVIYLWGNRLSDLPDGIFSGLLSLRVLLMHENWLRDLPDGIFSGLASLEYLDLKGNRLSSLPADVFSGLPALEILYLEGNQLRNLPDGIFSGLSALTKLHLQDNAVEPLLLPLSLDKVGDSQFKAVAPTGAPFSLVLPVSISGTGEIEGGARTVTIPAGAVESAPLKVAREAGTDYAVTVDLGTLPALPADHTGYVLEKDETLPREILPGPRAPPPGEVTGVEVAAGAEQLEVFWTAVSDAGGYKVQWKSGEEAYDESRLALIIGGDAISYTIAELTAGTAYTVRVVATKDNADDGSPSSEVTGIPKSLPPAQVTGVEVTTGVEQLDVSWTAVADASGYKVQWKSSEEAYDESRQAVVASGDTVSHTIAGLTAGTEYTVRVLATKDNADEGPASIEVIGVPTATQAGPVTGVEITAGVGQLAVSWTAVSDAGGYKVQWKSGEQEYDEARQAVIPDGDTVHYTIPDLTADTQYTIRVMATKDNADDGSPSAEVMATPTAVDPDVNGDGLLNGDDALVMYHAYASASQVGDGETGGTAASRQTLLSGLAGLANPSDEDLKAMIRKANGWRESGVDAGGDVNEDGEIDGEDAFVMYYAYELDELVGDGETGGTVRFRQLLLAAFANQPNPSDEDLKAMLRRANKLREEFG